MDNSGDTVPRPLDACGPDTDWSEQGAPRTMAVLSTVMIDELRQIEAGDGPPDLLEVVACSLRLREPLLLSIAVDGWVWPITVLPRQQLYRAPLDWQHAPPDGLRDARLLACEPPSVDPPALRPRTLPPCHYPIGGLLWSLALLGPRSALLRALARALDRGDEFRALDLGKAHALPRLPGALGSAVARLVEGPATFEAICRWPGLDAVRAARLLNGLYLEGRLVTEDGPLARAEGDSAWSDTQPSRWPLREASLQRPRTRRLRDWLVP